MTTSPPGPSRDRRRRALLAVSALAAALVVGGVVLGTRSSGVAPRAAAVASSAQTQAPASGSAVPTAVVNAAASWTPPPPPVTPVPSGPTGDVDQGPPSLPPVGLDATAREANGVSAVVAAVEPVEHRASAVPGDFAGPALRVTVRLTNGTSGPLPVDGATVDLTYGTDATPGSPLDDDANRPFTGTVRPGATAVAVYVFAVPADRHDHVQVRVSYQAGAPVLVFSGPVE